MANTKSAKKRARQTIRKTARNKARRSEVKTAIKKAYSLIQQGSETAADQIKASVVEAVAVVMKAANKGIIHKRTAARKVSRLTKALNQVAGAALAASSAEPATKTAPKKAAAKKKAAPKKKAAAKKVSAKKK